jgi:hypothetical protein
VQKFYGSDVLPVQETGLENTWTDASSDLAKEPGVHRRMPDGADLTTVEMRAFFPGYLQG